MHGERVIVLKFGGSVLRDAERLQLAVHEVYRWRRAGYGVVAVVSALAGATDALFERGRTISGDAGQQALATLASQGEQECAALLGLYLDRAGIPASVLSPASLRIQAEGPPLDATPVALDRGRLRSALDRDGVVVVPGYVAEDSYGTAVLLGRGGSDLTALFLAAHLGAARCRLLKDVDGLYERDPDRHGPPPSRYTQVTWTDALATDGSILQHEALRFAQTHCVEFEIGRLNGTRPTVVGPGPTQFGSADPRARLRVALIGLGTVGTGVWQHLRSQPGLFDVVRVAVREPSRAERLGVPADVLTTDALGAAASDVDVVIELMGGTDVARQVIEAGLASGADVVTANKRVLAQAGDQLTTLAASRGRQLLASAAVGGSVPLLERLAGHRPREVARVRGILNGTSNFLLDGCAYGGGFDAVLADARLRGFAESDASRDLTGRDAGDKLHLIARALGPHSPRVRRVEREAVTEEAGVRASQVASRGRALRQVATLELGETGVSARVLLIELEQGDPLYGVRGEHNAAVIYRRDGTSELLRGKGAGRWPTAEAVFADLLSIARSRASVLDPEAVALQCSP